MEKMGGNDIFPGWWRTPGAVWKRAVVYNPALKDSPDSI